jgi:hypothetical protein
MQPAQSIAEKVVETYYRLTDYLLPTTQEVTDWLESLRPLVRMEMRLLDFQQIRLVPGFKRHLLEGRGYFMQAYMAGHLTPEELSYWVDDNDGWIRLT